MLCDEATNVKRDGRELAVSVLHCKRWKCEICQPLCRWEVIQKGKRGKPTTFMTLTSNPHLYETPDAAARDMKRALVALRRRIHKRYGIKNLPFMCVFEKTKRGWPHLHILARAPWMDQKWLSDQMKDLIGAPVVDIRKIDNEGRAAAYVSKYVGKDPVAFQGCKRWWRSHNYECEEKDVRPQIMFGVEWEQTSFNINEWKEYAVKRGYNIVSEARSFLHMSKGAAPP